MASLKRKHSKTTKVQDDSVNSTGLPDIDENEADQKQSVIENDQAQGCKKAKVSDEAQQQTTQLETSVPSFVPTAYTLESLPESMAMMQRFLAAAIATICYTRGVFPDEMFVQKKLPDGSICKMLISIRDGKSNAKAEKVLQFLQGTFDAIAKRYLCRLDVGLSLDETNSDLIAEKYSFHFDYSDNGEPIMSVAPCGSSEFDAAKRSVSKRPALDVVKEDMTDLIHRLLFLGRNLEQFAEDREIHVTFRLYYHEECTPDEYEPPGFVASTGTEFVFDSDIVTNMDLGDVDTDFYSLQGGATSTLALFRPVSSSTNSASSVEIKPDESA